VKLRRSRPAKGQRFNPLAFKITIARSIFASDSLFSGGSRNDFSLS
jgi:hypothetical protein